MGSEQPAALAIFEDELRVRRQFFWAWVLYGLNTLVAVCLYFVFPMDRHLLEIYLFASVGPLIAQTYLISHLRLFRWLHSPALLKWGFVLVTGGMLVRGFWGGREGLYIYLLLAMGPLLATANLYTGMRVLALSRGSLKN